MSTLSKQDLEDLERRVEALTPAEVERLVAKYRYPPLTVSTALTDPRVIAGTHVVRYVPLDVHGQPVSKPLFVRADPARDLYEVLTNERRCPWQKWWPGVTDFSQPAEVVPMDAVPGGGR